jgi:hypothetical protein
MLPAPRPIESGEYSVAVIGVSFAAVLLFCYAALEFFVGYASQEGGSTLVAEVVKRFRTTADARLAAVTSAAQRPKVEREGAAQKPAARAVGLFRRLWGLADALAWATGRTAEKPLPPTPVDLTRIARPAHAAKAARTAPASAVFDPDPGAEAAVAAPRREDPLVDPAPAARVIVEPFRSREPARGAETDDLVLVEPGDAEAVSAARTRLVATG